MGYVAWRTSPLLTDRAARDNPLIRHGYRRPADGQPASAAEVASVTSARASGTARSRRAAAQPEPEAKSTYRHDSLYQCWRSVWDYWHNETINIHTHMWGGVVALLFLAMHTAGLLGALPAWWDWSFHGLRVLHPVPLPPESEAARLLHMDVRVRTQAPDWHDVLGFMAFLLSAAVCLGCSATYHTVSCHSQAVARSCNRLDYIGIVVLISGSFVPVLRYAFYCQPRVHLFFTLLQLTLASVAIYFVVQPKYATPAFRPVRAGVFVLLGLSGVGPVVYVLGSYGVRPSGARRNSPAGALCHGHDWVPVPGAQRRHLHYRGGDLCGPCAGALLPGLI